MKLSILTACHNDEKFISQCAESVLSQTGDFEWIVVDDCSDDNTHGIMSAISDPRITLLRNDSQMFCSSTYAKALKQASGDVCAIVDGDDAIMKNSVRTLMGLYARHRELGYIYTQHWWCNDKLKASRLGLSRLPPAGMSMSAASLKKNAHSFSHWRSFRRYLADKREIFPEGLKCSVDKYMGFVLERCAYGGFYSEPLYMYRYYKGNMSLTQAGEQKRLWKEMAAKFEAKGRALPVRKIK